MIIDRVRVIFSINILDDDVYTIQYIKLLIQNGLYVINDKHKSLREIYRLHGDR